MEDAVCVDRKADGIIYLQVQIFGTEVLVRVDFWRGEMVSDRHMHDLQWGNLTRSGVSVRP
jgi:hypothetical protein